MKKQKVNKPLILVSLVIVLFISFIGNPSLFPSSPIKSFNEGAIIFAITVGFLLILNFWFKAFWNNVVPAVFNTRKITYWESLGLVTLISMLVG